MGERKKLYLGAIIVILAFGFLLGKIHWRECLPNPPFTPSLTTLDKRHIDFMGDFLQVDQEFRKAIDLYSSGWQKTTRDDSGRYFLNSDLPLSAEIFEKAKQKAEQLKTPSEEAQSIKAAAIKAANACREGAQLVVEGNSLSNQDGQDAMIAVMGAMHGAQASTSSGRRYRGEIEKGIAKVQAGEGYYADTLTNLLLLAKSIKQRTVLNEAALYNMWWGLAYFRVWSEGKEHFNVPALIQQAETVLAEWHALPLMKRLDESLFPPAGESPKEWNRLDDAMLPLLLALQIDPSNMRAKRLLGEILMNRPGLEDTAAKLFQEATFAPLEQPYAYFYLGRMEEVRVFADKNNEAEHSRKAANYFSQSISSGLPKNSEDGLYVYRTLTDNYQKLGNYQAVATLLDDAASVYPEKVDLLYQRGEAYEQLDAERARAAYAYCVTMAKNIKWNSKEASGAEYWRKRAEEKLAKLTEPRQSSDKQSPSPYEDLLRDLPKR